MKKKKTTKPKRSDFWKLRHKVGLGGDAARCAELCGVTPRTIANWDTKGAPPMAMRLLHLYDRADLSGHGPEWAGWRMSRGRLMNSRLKLQFYPQNLRENANVCRQLGQLEAEAMARRECPLRTIWQPLAQWAATLMRRMKNL